MQDRAILGEKGGMCCELALLNLPIPPGFIITLEEMKVINDHPSIGKSFELQLKRHIHHLEIMTGKKFGGLNSSKEFQLPLLLSVRCPTFGWSRIPG